MILSSIIALVITIPKYIEIRFIIKKIIKVILRLIILRAISIVNIYNRVILTSLFRINNRLINTLMLVIII